MIQTLTLTQEAQLRLLEPTTYDTWKVRLWKRTASVSTTHQGSKGTFCQPRCRSHSSRPSVSQAVISATR